MLEGGIGNYQKDPVQPGARIAEREKGEIIPHWDDV